MESMVIVAATLSIINGEEQILEGATSCRHAQRHHQIALPLGDEP